MYTRTHLLCQYIILFAGQFAGNHVGASECRMLIYERSPEFLDESVLRILLSRSGYLTWQRTMMRPNARDTVVNSTGNLNLTGARIPAWESYTRIPNTSR